MTEHSQTNANEGADADDEISLLDLLQTIAENIRLLILGPLLIGLAALGLSFLIRPTFTANTKFLPPQQQQSAAASLLQGLGALGGLAGAATGIKNPSDQYVAFLKSRSVADPLIERFNLVQRYQAKLHDDARKALEASVRISSGKDGLITVEVDDHDPKVAADMANAYVEELGRLMSRLSLTEAQQRRAFFEKQLSDAKTNLTRAEQALKSSGVNLSALKSSPEAVVTAVAQLQAQIAAQEVKVASMRGYLTESAPDFKQALTELAAIRSQLARAARSEPRPAQGVDADYVARFRDYKYYETLFELFAKQFELAKVDESREGSLIQVVDVAQVPERKSKPKKALIAVIASLASGFLLLLFVFVRSALRKARQDPRVAERLTVISQSLRGR